MKYLIASDLHGSQFYAEKIVEIFNKELEKLSILKQNIYELRKLYDEVNNEVVQKLLKDIIKISDKIYKEVVVNTDKLYKLDRFNNYYLITIQKIVKKYINLSKNKIRNSQNEEFFIKIEEFLKNVTLSFNNLYQSLYTDEIIDLDAEMQVMEKEMKI